MPKFHKLHRGICLALFLASSIASYFNPHMLYIAGFSILGVIAYDIVCLFRQNTEIKDLSPELSALTLKVEESAQHIKEMKADVSVAKMASTFRRG